MLTAEKSAIFVCQRTIVRMHVLLRAILTHACTFKHNILAAVVNVYFRHALKCKPSALYACEKYTGFQVHCHYTCCACAKVSSYMHVVERVVTAILSGVSEAKRW